MPTSKLAVITTYEEWEPSPGHPSQGLPVSPGFPSQGLPPAPAYPSHPWVPPAPGIPAHPIAGLPPCRPSHPWVPPTPGVPVTLPVFPYDPTQPIAPPPEAVTKPIDPDTRFKLVWFVLLGWILVPAE